MTPNQKPQPSARNAIIALPIFTRSLCRTPGTPMKRPDRFIRLFAIRLKCKVTVRQRILDPKGNLVVEFDTTKEISSHRSVSVTQDSPRIRCPQLWSPDSPALYQVETLVMDGDSVLDKMRSPLGFRWFR